MFGMGFTEILFIAVIAILFLGPDKLPDAMVQIAKLFKSIKETVNEAKSSFEDEIHIKELREEALNYRKQYEKAANDISGFKNSIPNPAAELQDAISSISSDRYLDDDIMADIEEAENRWDTTEKEELEQEEAEPEEVVKKEEDKKIEKTTKKKSKKSTRRKAPEETPSKPKKNTKTATTKKQIDKIDTEDKV